MGGDGEGRAPKQYSTCSAVSKHKIVIISKTKGVLSKNSSDLGLGRRPIAISDEFLESTPPSYRDIDVPFSDFFRKRYIVRERDPKVALHGHEAAFRGSEDQTYNNVTLQN